MRPTSASRPISSSDDVAMLAIPKRVGSEHLGSFQVFDVYRHRMRSDDDGADFNVHCLTMPDWVTVVALTGSDEVVLVRQLRFGVDEVMLETPGGIIDERESPDEAAARELREETGYVAASLRSLGWVHPNPAIQNNRIHLLVAEGCQPTATKQLDEHESTEVVVVDRASAVRMLRRGDIRHALSALALERAFAVDSPALSA